MAFTSFLDMFGGAVSRHPDKTALALEREGELRSVTFAELDRAGSRIAAAVSSQKTAGRGPVVPIALPRSPETIAAVIGVWRAGAAASVINMEWPAERRRQILAQCFEGADGLSADDGFVIDGDWITGVQPFAVQTPGTGPKVTSCSGNLPEQLALVVFTSGSTGSPKGVMLSHRAAASGCMVTPHVDESYVGLTVISLSFVVLVCDLLCYLSRGCTVHIAGEDLRHDPARLAAYTAKYGCGVSFFPPHLAGLYLEHAMALNDPKGRMRQLTIGSDRVRNLYSAESRFVVGYGATETTGAICYFDIDKPYENTPIGWPRAGNKGYIVKDDGTLASPGEEGEICFSGPAMASGYYNNPGMTAERFTPNPFCAEPGHETLYHSHDLGRMDADGCITFIQRSDWMLKIRGNRVEPGEVEAAMMKVAPLSRAIAVGFESQAPGQEGQTRLYACYTADTKIDPRFVKEELARLLPDYMVPAFIEQRKTMPVNANGKIDRTRLGPPDIERCRTDYVPPADADEELICDAYAKVFGLKQAGVNDDFDALGGDSLFAAELAAFLSPLDINVPDFKTHKTPRQLARMKKKK